ncbi:MAG TPA: hypothetical protein VI356_00135 [Myxococcales bacterium]
MHESPEAQSGSAQQPPCATHVFDVAQALYPAAQITGLLHRPDEHVCSPTLPGSEQSEFTLQVTEHWFWTQ